MKQSKDLSIVNCIAISLLAVFLSIPVHEFIHFIFMEISVNTLRPLRSIILNSSITEACRHFTESWPPEEAPA